LWLSESPCIKKQEASAKVKRELGIAKNKNKMKYKRSFMIYLSSSGRKGFASYTKQKQEGKEITSV